MVLVLSCAQLTYSFINMSNFLNWLSSIFKGLVIFALSLKFFSLVQAKEFGAFKDVYIACAGAAFAFSAIFYARVSVLPESKKAKALISAEMSGRAMLCCGYVGVLYLFALQVKQFFEGLIRADALAWLEVLVHMPAICFAMLCCYYLCVSMDLLSYEYFSGKNHD